MSTILTRSGLLDWERLDALVAENYITARTHRTEPLTIYNYTPKTVYNRVWEPTSIACRGLIVDKAKNIVARPFEKFWNLGENGSTWLNEPYEIYEKMDGSLGISYMTSDGWAVATRGSFHSDQARDATTLLRSKYASALPQMDPLLTYLWEIILPSNRIVVDYGDQQELVLLAVLDTASGEELPLDGFGFPDLGFPLVKRYPPLTEQEIQLAMLEENTNREGFVVRFASGVRVKVKLSEYSRIHRLVTQVTPRRIWEHLSQGDDLTALTALCPPAYQEWVARSEAELRAHFIEIELACKQAFANRPDGDRKTQALYFQQFPYTAVLFRMLDDRDYADVIWKEIYPPAAQPFKVEV